MAELKFDLEKLLMQMPVDEETAMEKLNQIAVAMYGAIDPREYETYRMRQAFQNEHPRTELDAGLIAMNIDAVRTDSKGKISIMDEFYTHAVGSCRRFFLFFASGCLKRGNRCRISVLGWRDANENQYNRNIGPGRPGVCPRK